MTTLITLGSFTCTSLTAQPYAYEGEARTGLTAQTFRISGLLTPAQWKALRDEYDSWRNSRIQDEDTLKSGTVGTTINLTIASINGISVSSLKCWFIEPPAGEQAGAYISASAVLVDATQALAVLLRSQEKQRENQEALVPSLGTVSFGNCTVTLTRPMETRQDGPQVARTATGASYITGPLSAHKVRQVEGYISSGSYSDLLSWYDSTVGSYPTASSWFPVTPPQATAEVIIDGGVKSTRYSVSITALQII